ncbi:MAG: precorrin-2 C(20)-methyltransferase [Nitrospirae bacterium]|nr:MAG: precorrin-2 C(20)-methyltransferase [Nitrospirota bacterium]
MTGALYVIGVGPGDPELLTLKAVRLLKEAPCICVPKGREEGSSLALSIVEKAVDLKGKEIIEAHFPMRKTKLQGHAEELDAKWQGTVDVVSKKLLSGVNMVFITIGDPTFYSTFFYLYDKLLELIPLLNIEFVPGISSINASASRAKLCLALADEKIAVLPATYTDGIRETLEKFDTVVLMKVHRVFFLVRELLGDMGLLDKAHYIVRAGMADERIFDDLRTVKEEDLNYFSLIVVKK